jgi:glycosyltransferase involved in cell wall biosynthesis
MKFREFLSGRTILENGYHDLTPQISVVMPTYRRNAEGLLTRCVDSVLAQTFEQFELIVVDDGSVDGTEGVMREYAARDPRIVYVRHEENSGLPAVRTDEGIMLARSSYVSFIFDDNVWAPDALQSMLQAMESDPVDVVYANMDLARHREGALVLGRWPLTIDLLQLLNTIPNGAVLCGRQFFDIYGLYDPHLILRRLCDFDLWLRALRLGARFRHLDRTVGTEYGPVSMASLGRSVDMDFKVTYAYLVCEVRLHERVRALRPEQIEHYDVFNTEAVLRYLRDTSEWSSVEERVYKPFFSTHPHYSYEPPILHNRRYETTLTDYSLNPPFAINTERRRVLLVSNRFSRIVQEWKDALTAHARAIVVSCPESGLSAFLPAEIDLVILFDCTAPSVRSWMHQFHDSDVPIIYVVTHGLDETNRNDGAALRPLDLGRSQPILETLGTPRYFALPGVPWSAELRLGAQALIELADQIVSIGSHDPKDDLAEHALPLQFVANGLSDESFDGPVCGAIYLGDPQGLPAETISALDQFLRHAAADLRWQVYVFPHTQLPAALAPYQDRCTVRITTDTLSRVAATLQDTCLFVPQPLLSVHADYHRRLIEEDLARNRCALASLPGDGHAAAEPVTAAALAEEVRAFLERVSQRGSASRPDARALQVASVALAVMLRKKLERMRPAVRQRPVKVAVLLNSPLLAGSETIGLLWATVLSRLGFEVTVCIPKVHDHGPAVDGGDVDVWLQQHGLSPAIRADYGMGGRCFLMPDAEAWERSERFCAWLDERDVDVVLCAGLISEPLIAAGNDRLIYAELMQPVDYILERLTSLRSRPTGVCSDSQWACGHWSRWFAPPVNWVPTVVEGNRFVDSQPLPSEPIRIAVGGTIQPRKRQIEAIRAIEQLAHDGYDVELNVYGYELPTMAEYIAKAKSLAARSPLRERIRFHGLVDITKIVEENHLLLMPSIDESMPLTLLHAMAGGLVPVACPAGGIPEVVRDGETGFLANGFSVEDISAALRRAVSQRDQWSQLATHGRALLVNEHSEPIATHRLLEFMMRGAEIASSDGAKLFRRRAITQCFSPIGPDADSALVIGPDISDTALRYSLELASDRLCGIQFRIGTHYTTPRGNVKLCIRSHAIGKTVREVSFDLRAIVDNGWFKIEFEPIARSEGQRFDVLVSAKLSRGRLAFYEVAAREQSKVRHLAARVDGRVRRLFKLPVPRAMPAFLPMYVV